MGVWKSGRGVCGDRWADLLDNCKAELAKAVIPAGSKTYGEEEHEITMAEFADLVEFCSRGHLIVSLRHEEDGIRPLSHSKEVKTYSNSGQIHCPDECPV